MARGLSFHSLSSWDNGIISADKTWLPQQVEQTNVY